MYIPFEEMPLSARVWIYQANRELSDAEVSHALQLGQQFTDRWAAHGQPLRASVQVFYRHFLVIAVDEGYNAASGCSIDSSVALVRELEQRFSAERSSFSFFDRTQIAFWQNDTIQLYPMSQAKGRIKEGAIRSDTLTFDNTVPTKETFETRWRIPVKASWLARYLPKISVS